MLRNILFISTIVLLALACKKTETPSFHTEYFGLSEGRFVIYDVVDITHDAQVSQHDTLIYQLKTHWGEEYIDNEGRVCRKFRRYTRDSSAANWTLKDTWYGLIDGIRAELVEENQRKVKLVFSPTKDKAWDENAYSTLPTQDCYYNDIHKTKTIGGTQFDSTVVVEKIDETNALITKRFYEVYAKNIGLIEFYFMDNDYQFSTEVYKGKELYLTFNSAGFE